MTEDTKHNENPSSPPFGKGGYNKIPPFGKGGLGGFSDEDEINLLDYWRVIWKRRAFISCIVVVMTLATAIASLFMTDIYQAKAVIKPVTPKEGGTGMSALAQQFGGMAGLAGVALPGSTSATELVALLKSNILRGKIIERYQLLPILFYNQWDGEKKTWKKGSHFSLNPLALVSKIRPGKSKADKGEKDVPDTWDGLRALDNVVKVVYNVKDDAITVSADFPDPEMAARMVEYFLSSLNDHTSSEAKRIAAINRKYLEEQLGKTGDVILQQRIYNLIANQIETTMMAEVKENFAFKVLDPPLTPDKKSKPKRTQMVIISFIVSLFLSIFIAFFIEYLKKIKATPPGGLHAD